MSHLSTICDRVERRLEVYGGDEVRSGRDPLFIQAVNNLKEYQGTWTDFTKDEQDRANKLYDRLSGFLVIDEDSDPDQPKYRDDREQGICNPNGFNN